MNIIVISSPQQELNEASIIGALFEHGLEVFHLRKPTYSIYDTEALIQAIEPKFRDRVVLHHHYALAEKYNLRGIHFTGHYVKSHSDQLTNWYDKAKQQAMTVSGSKHQLKELETLEVPYNYVFLSPVFDSISKAGYKSNFADLKSIEKYKSATQLIALGGISLDKIDQVKRMGFDGAAVLGTVWEKPAQAIAVFMELKAAWEKKDQIF
ncbi:thiamine phosphate synthase [Microscilla marina]|uniref:Thiamine phosphate pyrophosphorylase n=1 Tax=Microscilla marina ATCC 23134 TaxID=313606 RepID=A1ZKW6_MICM2|nr:thiamine phosphate synthase [Microscilla marina]EAY28932.1 thiamine phosphate pyrophosphorylase [Microscilla marina ATCC 23134]